MEKAKNFFKKIHTDMFKWTDEALIVMLVAALIVIFGMGAGSLLTKPFEGAIEKDESGFMTMFFQYFSFIGCWILLFLVCVISKRNRPILSALWTAPKGNDLKHLGLGLAIGFGMNMICAVAAMLNKDIMLYYGSFHPLKLLLLFIAVFIQSSAEELICRGFLYQALRRGYRHVPVAMILNAALFAILHLPSPGVTALSIINIFVVGILFSFMVYYMDSLWCAMAAHTAWNFTQNMILGLPNSGIVSPYSVFKLDAASAVNSYAYNVGFGIEGTVMAIIVFIVSSVLIFVLYHKKDVRPYDPWENK